MEAKMSDIPEAKKPCKGILKTSSSFDKQSSSSMGSYRKNAKFDETNVLQTYHPADKDYGHMKVDEPKTPFVFTTESDPGKEFDPDLLAEKLRAAANTQTPGFTYDNDDSEEELEESLTDREFEKRRKAHYNEFKAVLLARKLIQVELEADSEEDGEQKSSLEGVSTYSPSENDGGICGKTSSKLNDDTNTDEASSIDNTCSPASRLMDVENSPISTGCNQPNSENCHCYTPH